MDDAAPINPQNSVLPNTPLSPPLSNQTPAPGPKNKFLSEFSTSLAKKILLLFVLLLIAIPLVGFALSQKQLPQKEDSKFELSESFPEDQNSYIPVVSEPTFVFSKSIGIQEKDLEKFVTIQPRPKGNWHIEKNKKALYFSKDVKQPNSLSQTLDFNKFYTIKIKKDFSSSNGKKLDKDIEVSFRTEKNLDYPSIELDAKLVNFFPDQEKNIPLRITEGKTPLFNLKLHVIIKTASEEQVLSYFKSKKGQWPLYAFLENSANKVVEEFNFEPNQIDLLSSKLYLPLKISKTGIYFVTLDNEKMGKEDFFVSISNHVNQVFGDLNNVYVWTTDYKTSSSLSNISIRLFSNQEGEQKIADSGKTDNKGIFVSKKSLDDINFVITKTGEDTAITWLDFYRRLSPEYPDVFSYTDRPVYRPGDKVHYKAILRETKNGSYAIPKNKKFYALLSDYTKNSNKDYKELITDDNGTLFYDFTLSQSSQINYSNISLFIKDSGKFTSIDSHYLNVSAYRKPDMEIEGKTDEDYISKDIAKDSLFAKTLYGEPLINTPFSYRVIANDFSEIRDRNFEDSSRPFYYGNGNQISAGKGTFDEKGRAQISFPTDLSSFEKSQFATIEISPNIGASPSIGKRETLIHRGEFALFFESEQSQAATISGNVLSLDHGNPRKPYSLGEVEISLYKVLSYENKNFLEKKNISGESSFSFSFQNLQNGSYEVVAKGTDKRGNIVTSRNQFYVTATNVASDNQNKYPIEISAKKDRFEPGEETLLDIKANFKVENALVVVYSEKQISSVEELKPGKESFDFLLKIPNSQGKTLGVDILTIFQGNVTQAHKDIKINYEAKKISTSIKFNKNKLKPGETVEAEITTTDSFGKPVAADNSLAIFDSALLQIRNRSYFDVFSSFYSDEYTNLMVFDSTRGIYRGGGGGGGGGGDGDQPLRENFVDTAYWNPHIQTDSSGKAKVSFKLPDNLTTFAADVVSSSKDSAFGQTSSEFISKKDFAIIPTIPNFYYQGDMPILSALVQNSSENDFDGNAIISVREINFSKSFPIHILKGDYVSIKTPAKLNTEKNSLTFLIKINDKSGKTLDSLQLKKPILPRENLKSTLEFSDYSTSIQFTPKYLGLDFNTLNLSITPHKAWGLFRNAYLDGEPNVKNTQALYVWSYILDQTKSGTIPPNSYKYARTKNEFRQALNYMLALKMPQGDQIFWYPKYASADESRLTINLWARQALIQAKETGMADEVTNLSEIIKKSHSYILNILNLYTKTPPVVPKILPVGEGFTLAPNPISPPEPITELKESQKFLLTWFGFGSYISGEKNLDLAASVLKGNDKSALEKLKKERYLSADDRYIFDGKTIYSKALPALALIEKGSKEDSEKAIKGLSFSAEYYDEPFDLLAGVKDAIKRGIDLENVGLKIVLNGETINEVKIKDMYFNDLSYVFDEKADLRIETKGNFPFYIISIKTELDGQDKNKDNLADKILNFFTPAQESKGKIIDTKLSRKYINIENRQNLPKVQEGQSAIAELTFRYPFKYISSYSRAYEVNLTDTISPSLMYLNQIDENSTQNFSTLDKFYPQVKEDKLTKPYVLPATYSDEAVSFGTAGTGYLNPIFTYVVFGISSGDFYQPKTAAVLPKLGLIIEEK